MTDTPGTPPPSSPDGYDRPPVDPQGVFTPPAPPPGTGYQYAAMAMPPAQPKRGVLSTLGKLAGVLSFAVAVFFIGFYLGIAMIAADASPVRAGSYRAGEGDEKIAIIPVYGSIADDTAEFIRLAVDATIADDRVRAVVLHIDSPGGFVGPSEQIHHHLQRLRAARSDLPIIASYGSVAASGGYYVSCGADYIFCEPTGLTGSIGVIASVPIMKDLFEQKLGVKMLVMTAETSPDKDVANDVFRDWNERDTDLLRDHLTQMHERFLEVVQAGRVDTNRMTADQFDDSTRGLAYLADDALRRGLIDEVGYLDQAIAMAGERGGIASDTPPVVRYGVRLSPLAAMFGAEAKPLAGLGALSLDANDLRRTLLEVSAPHMMYLYRP